MDEKIIYELKEKLFIKWWGESGNHYMGDPFMKLRAAFYEGYDAGCREQARVDREAVIKYTDGCHHKNPDGVAMCIELPALLAALREAGK